MAEIDLDKKFDCDKCKKFHLDKNRNCDGSLDEGDPGSKRVQILEAVPRMYVDRCPKRLLEEAERALELWEDFSTFQALKALPYPGGTKDQPAVIIEAILFCKGLYNALECDQKFMDWRNRKDKRKDNGLTGEKKLTSLGDVLKLRGKRRQEA